MHDINELDQRGVPGLFIASAEFAQASAAQSKSLGFDAPVIFVEHPIQDRTDAEMRVIADGAFSDIVNKLLADG